MQRDFPDSFIRVCQLADILPDSGVCALVHGEQVAVFRVDEQAAGAADGKAATRIYAIGNYDANAHAAVLSRGLVGNLGERLVVASPIYKQHFDLRTGECLEVPAHSVAPWRARLVEGAVWVGR